LEHRVQVVYMFIYSLDVRKLLKLRA
jgi:hypothetical protein